MLTSTRCLVLFLGVGACAGPPPERPAQDSARPASRTQEILTYRACPSANPGALIPLPRRVPADQDPIASAVAELVKGVNAREAALGCTSFFSPQTADALRSVRHSGGGDTVLVDFRNFTDALSAASEVKSFLSPGIMAELTWTLFSQFEHIDAVRFSFDGDERAFWQWLGGPEARAQVFTRVDWERI